MALSLVRIVVTQREECPGDRGRAVRCSLHDDGPAGERRYHGAPAGLARGDRSGYTNAARRA